VLGLQEHNDSLETGKPVPDLHEFLDSDLDGLINDEDNCRYVANPDQEPVAGQPFGEACDFRLDTLSMDEFWGCGITAYESEKGPAGTITCWEVQGAKTGGAPPHPALFPGAPIAPWRDGNPFGGMGGDTPTFLDVSIAGDGPDDAWICAVPHAGGTPIATMCWDQNNPGTPFELSVPILNLSMSSERVCGSSEDGFGSFCFSRTGAEAMSTAAIVDQMKLVGSAHLCGISAEGTFACVDGTGNAVPLPAPLDGAEILDFDANTAGGSPFGCAVLADDGSVACFTLDESAPYMPPPTPPGTGFVEVAVGLGVACASTAEGEVTCTRRDDEDPAVLGGDAHPCGDFFAAPPPYATNLVADECQVCGIDQMGFGVCWPTNWERARGEGEPIIDALP
jgi:hypothetical protein